jgi:hypothetical protein
MAAENLIELRDNYVSIVPALLIAQKIGKAWRPSSWFMT